MKTTQTWIAKKKKKKKKTKKKIYIYIYIFKILNIKIKLGGVGCKINKVSPIALKIMDLVK